MELIVDTHMALWYLDGSPMIPERAKEAIGDGRNAVYVSDASAWEVAIKHMKRPEAFSGSAAEFMRRCDAVGFLRLPIDRGSISEYEKLDTSRAEGVHRDPFDRMLIAQARAANMMLVTHDKALRLYGEPNVMVF